MAPLRDIAVILLALEAMVLMLVPAAVIGVCWYGVKWLRRKLPPLFAQARKILALVRLYVERTGAAVAAPLITICGSINKITINGTEFWLGATAEANNPIVIPAIVASTMVT